MSPAEEIKLKKLQQMCYSKVGHRTILSAQYALDEMTRIPNSGLLVIYPCPICKLFHIGKNKRLEDDKSKQSLLHNTWSVTNSDSSIDLPMEE